MLARQRGLAPLRCTPNCSRHPKRFPKPRPYLLDCPWCFGTGCSRCQNGVLVMRTCPACLEVPGLSTLIRTHAWVKRGHLPAPGPWTAQASRLMRAVEFIDRVLPHLDAKAAE